MKNTEPFQIVFLHEVVFKDIKGTCLKAYQPGDITEATYEHPDLGYFVTAMGGIWKEEAMRVSPEN